MYVVEFVPLPIIVNQDTGIKSHNQPGSYLSCEPDTVVVLK